MKITIEFKEAIKAINETPELEAEAMRMTPLMLFRLKEQPRDAMKITFYKLNAIIVILKRSKNYMYMIFHGQKVKIHKAPLVAEGFIELNEFDMEKVDELIDRLTPNQTKRLTNRQTQEALL